MAEEILIVGGAVLGLIIIAYQISEKRKRRREKIRLQVARAHSYSTKISRLLGLSYATNE